ncbi:MAG: ABC-F family ATP-binding cassette domain-containing protein [Puniceicoccales bacterium]|nr:ABC-F family ATP-binding cassette domain-containing protein [Puniceicoccales bacterium]
MIDVRNLTYSIGGRILLNDLSFYLPTDGTIGIVGANGCGKSTLFRLILGDISSDQGTIIKPNASKVVTVRQEIKDDSVGLLNFVLQSDRDLMDLRRASEEEQDGMKLAEIFEKIEAIDGFNAEIRASTILSGLGFLNEDLQKPLKDFSGGWQIRAALGATLFAPSDILLLDEPSNHLDFETSLWLRNYLQRIHGQKTIIIVSHERDFLNTLCDKILHLPSGILYAGNYDIFIETRANQQQALAKRIEKQETARKHLQSFVDRFRYKASKAKQAQSRIKMIEKMEKLPKLDRDYTVRFSFPNPKPIDRVLIQVKKGIAGYGDHIVLEDLNLKIDAGDRFALLGANGNGKSTLVKVLSDRLALFDGVTEFAKKLQIAYFSQHLTDELDVTKTPFEILSTVLSDSNETQVRSQLARFGLMQQKSDTRVKNLSGGEKTRLLLAIITRQAPHILILDEPTNHLDIEAKDALIEALNEYEGAVVLVSHDFYLIESVSDQLLLVKDRRCQPFTGDLNDYVEVVLAEKRATKKSENTAKERDQSPLKNEKKRKQIAKELEKIEKIIGELTQKKKILEEKLSRNYTHENAEKLDNISENLSSQEQEWLNLSRSFENLAVPKDAAI